MDSDQFKKAFSDIADLYGINGNVLFAVMLALAVNGMGSWNGARVMQVIELLKQGKSSGEVIEDVLRQRFGVPLN